MTMLSRMSAVAEALEVSRKVLTPVKIGAGLELVQSNTSARFCDMTTLGVMAKTKDCAWPDGMLAGVLSVPVVVLVAGSVVW